MEKWQISYITENLSELVGFTQCNTILLTKLLERGVLCENDMDILKTLKVKEGDIRQSYELYSILKTRVNAYDILLDSLTLTKQTGAAKILSDGVPVRKSDVTLTILRRQPKVSKPNQSEAKFNAIVSGLNGELFSKLWLDDLTIIPKSWTLRYMNVFYPSDTDLQTILCDSKYPLYINTNTGSLSFIIFLLRPLSGETVKIDVRNNISVEYLKFLFYQETGIAINEYNMFFKGKVLENIRTLQSYNIQKECIILVNRRSLGGAGFDTMNLGANQKTGIGQPARYKWEAYKTGLNVTGNCFNKTCPTQECTDGQTISWVQYVVLRLNRNNYQIPCAACQQPFTPVNFLVTCGKSLFRFKQQNDDEIKSVTMESFEGYEKYKIFDPLETSVAYDVIEIITVSQDCSTNFCVFCEKKLEIGDEYIYECEHSAHKTCAENKGCCICEAKFLSTEELETMLQNLKLKVPNINKSMGKPKYQYTTVEKSQALLTYEATHCPNTILNLPTKPTKPIQQMSQQNIHPNYTSTSQHHQHRRPPAKRTRKVYEHDPSFIGRANLRPRDQHIYRN